MDDRAPSLRHPASRSGLGREPGRRARCARPGGGADRRAARCRCAHPVLRRSPGMRPPLALLVYAADDPAHVGLLSVRGVLARMAGDALGARHGRPVRFIDWPAGDVAGVARPPNEQRAAAPERGRSQATPDECRGRRRRRRRNRPLDVDPLDRLAEVSGHDDGEALWNALIESRRRRRTSLPRSRTAMTALRRRDAAEAAADRRRPARSPARGAYAPRHPQARAEGARRGRSRSSVGAWHVPALRSNVAGGRGPRDARAACRRLKTEITWVPWTDTRLAAASGYGAGVVSPGWYGISGALYEGDAARVARTCFAATLAGARSRDSAARRRSCRPRRRPRSRRRGCRWRLGGLRGHAMPGLAEMRDASLAALCHGDETPFRLIERRLVIGKTVGDVDDERAADAARGRSRAAGSGSCASSPRPRSRTSRSICAARRGSRSRPCCTGST